MVVRHFMLLRLNYKTWRNSWLLLHWIGWQLPLVRFAFRTDWNSFKVMLFISLHLRNHIVDNCCRRDWFWFVLLCGSLNKWHIAERDRFCNVLTTDPKVMNRLLNTSRKWNIVQIPSNGSHSCKLVLVHCITEGGYVGVKWLKKLYLLENSFVCLSELYWVGLWLHVLVRLHSAISLVNTLHDVLKVLLVQLAVSSWATDVLLKFFKHTSVFYYVYHLMGISRIYRIWALLDFRQKMVGAFYYWRLVSSLYYERIF